MNVELKEIIASALPLIEKQVGYPYNKYELEKELRYYNPRPADAFKNILPDIIANWAVDDSQIVLIEVICHDLHSRALLFENTYDLESHLLSGSSFLNMFCTYVIPIVKGKVMDFEVYTCNGEKIVKYVFDETGTPESTENCKIAWKS